MQAKLYWLGVVLAALAAVFGLVSIDNSHGGSDVSPMGALAVAVAAIGFLYASTIRPKS